MFASRVSIMVLPTKKMRASSTPARRRLALACSLVVKNQLLTASVARRLISSGIVQSPERIPASTCATGTCSFCAVMAQAIVEVTSPTTRQQALRCCISRRS